MIWWVLVSVLVSVNEEYMKTIMIEKWTRRVYYAAWALLTLAMAVVVYQGTAVAHASSDADKVTFGFVLLGLWFVGAMALPWLAMKAFRFFISGKLQDSPQGHRAPGVLRSLEARVPGKMG